MSDLTPFLNSEAPADNAFGSFVLADHKVVYIPCTKVACTTFRWMVADLAGEDFNRFIYGGGGFQSRLMTIHRGHHKLWKHALRYKDSPPTVQQDISRDNGWFIFGVVRDPWSRLWSAWQSKFLVRQPMYVRMFADEPWFPRVPNNAAEVLEDWRAFVAAEPWKNHPKMLDNRHFLPQVLSVQPERINYTRIYDISEISTLVADLGAHLERIGKPQPLYLPRANENPLVFTPAVLAEGVDEAIRNAYADDLAAFPDFGWRPEDAVKADDWTADAIRIARFRIDSNERIADLSAELTEAKRGRGRKAGRTGARKGGGKGSGGASGPKGRAAGTGGGPSGSKKGPGAAAGTRKPGGAKPATAAGGKPAGKGGARKGGGRNAKRKGFVGFVKRFGTARKLAALPVRVRRLTLENRELRQQQKSLSTERARLASEVNALQRTVAELKGGSEPAVPASNS
jgi:hypothetical protein